MARLYPSVISTTSTAPGTPQGNGTNNALAIHAQALAGQNNVQPQQTIAGLATTVSTSANYDKKFGMRDGDVDRICTMCGLKAGQGAGLSSWFAKMNEKGNTKDGQRTLLRKMLGLNLKYEEHPILCTPAVLDMIMKKTFTVDGDYYQTTTGVMKGLSPFLFAPQTAEDIATHKRMGPKGNGDPWKTIPS